MEVIQNVWFIKKKQLTISQESVPNTVDIYTVDISQSLEALPKVML